MAGEYADVERVLTDLLQTVIATRTVTELPAGDALTAVLPVIQVEAFGGTDLDPAMEAVAVDIDCFVGPDVNGEPDRGGAHDLAERARTALLRTLVGQSMTYSGVTGTVARVDTIARPTIRPWDESNIRRCHASYRVTTKSRG